MKLRAAGFVVIALILCGCSDADWDNALSFGPAENSDAAPGQVAQADAPPVSEAAPPPVTETVMAPQPTYSVTQTVVTATPLPSANPTTGYCRTVAQSSGASATRDGMDGPAQQQAADATYRQCMTLYGGDR
jgi:hypothetical protein